MCISTSILGGPYPTCRNHPKGATHPDQPNPKMAPYFPLCPAVLQLEGRDGNLIDLRDAAQSGVPMMPCQCGFPTKQAIPPTPVLQKVQ